MRSAVAIAAFLTLSAAAEIHIKPTADRPPRKVIVGTAMQAFWEAYPGLEKRLAQLAGLVDQMAAESQKKYGRGWDIAILPETSVTGESSGDVMEHSVPLDGPLRDVFSRKAREHRSYIVVPTYLLEDKQKKLCSNAAILFGRKGELVGI